MLKQKFKEFLFNSLLVICSILISLIIIEFGLRIFLPKYNEAADSILKSDYFPRRIPNASVQRKHPDTGREHKLIFNNLGLRQSRDIFVDNKEHRFRIGVFGDSFVENTGLSVEYGIVEVLNYLLNSNEDKFEVINFGMNGYGTDTSYLSFLKRPVAKTLNFILYVYCNNDLMDIYEHKVFSIDQGGKLVFTTAQKGCSIWKKSVSRLCLTYLVLDAKLKFSSWFNIRILKRGYHSPEALRFQNDFLTNCKSSDIEQTIKIYQ